MTTTREMHVLLAALALLPAALLGGPGANANLPECDKNSEDCGCKDKKKEITANCIKVDLDLGETTPWTGSLECSLKVFADGGSPNVFSQDSLYAVLGGYTFKRLGQRTMPDGATPAEVVFSHPNGEPVHFVFANGESLGRPDPGVHVKMDERLQMVDAEGWATASGPVYYDLYVGDGTRRRFLATNATGALGALVSVTDARGRTVTPADMGVEIVYDANGVRQFLTPSRLADVTPFPGFGGFEVKVYPLQSVPQRDAATGLYVPPPAPPVRHLQVRPENGWRRAVVTLRRGGNDPMRYVFDYAMGDWSLTRPSGVEDRKEREISDGGAAYIRNETIAADGAVLSRKVKNYQRMSWGFAMTNRVEGFGGVTDTTTWTYYTSGNGKGQVKTERRQSGLLVQYAYDSLDRVISETRSGPDMMTETTTYDYTPVDPSDPALPVDTRPRTVVKKLDGIECERTYYAYTPLTNIVERVGAQGAAYGGTNALRTVTAYYPVVDGDPRSGFVRSIRHEDGRLDLYDYALSSNIWTRMVTHLHEQSPAPVSGKTTRDITLTNARGEALETRTEAFVEGNWHIVARETHTFNSEGKRIASENLAGQVTTTAWDCCHKVSEIQPDGSTTTWDYDTEGRVIASSRLIPLDMTNVTWLTTCYEYDAIGRQTATWQTNFAAQVGLPAERTAYDALGRVIARVDRLGNTTTTTYSTDGRTVSVLNPNTSTRIISRSAYGDTLSITGSAVTPEFHTYGILSDGTRWSRTVQGETASSPRFAKRYENLLGQTIREERSGFRGVVLTTEHAYDSLGRLVATVADYEPTIEHSYDVLGNRISSTHSIGNGEWRKKQKVTSFEIDDGKLWLVHSDIVSCYDEMILPQIETKKIQLSNFNVPITSQQISTTYDGLVTSEIVEMNDGYVIHKIRTNSYANTDSLLERYGYLCEKVLPSLDTIKYEYDYLGRILKSVDARGCTQDTEYNQRGLILSIDIDGNKSTYQYDDFGNVIAICNLLGNNKVFRYDLRGNQIYEGGATYPADYCFDIFGNMIEMQLFRDENKKIGGKTIWRYDIPSGLVTNRVYANGLSVKYDYDIYGRLQCRTWARGVAADFNYDDWGAVTNICYSDATPEKNFVYDALGRLISVRDSSGCTTFSYNSKNKTSNVVYTNEAGESHQITYHYDIYSRETGYSVDGNRKTIISRLDNDGKISSMIIGRSNLHTNSFVWSYLPNSDLVSKIQYPCDYSTLYLYEENNKLIHKITNSSPTDNFSEVTYRYDSLFRQTSANNILYSYNSRGELASVRDGSDSTFIYDDIGNRILITNNTYVSTYLANNLNQYVSISDNGETFYPEYDADGNQTLVKTSTGVWSINYDGENRPVSWKYGDKEYHMKFDWKGRRRSLACYRNQNAETVKEFVYDGYKVVLEIEKKTDASNVEKDIIWDPTLQNLSKPLCVKVGDMIYLLFHDARRNLSDIVSVTNSTTTISHVKYSATGEITSKTYIDSVSFLWASEYFDSELDLIYYNYRFYNPQTGRWLTRDPIDDINEDALSKTHINKTDYLMLSNDMVNNSDWLGLKEVRRIECGSCVICIDNDAASGDGNHYKLHYTCNRNGSRPKGCRKGDGDEHGDAQFPLLTPSHGHSGVPNKIKKCLDKKLKWQNNPVTLPVADPITKCCKEEEFENWNISLSGTPALSAEEYQIVVCSGFAAAAFVAFLIKISPALLLL